MSYILHYQQDYIWIFYINTTQEQNKQIKEDLDKLYPNGYNKFQFYNYIKERSCEYCLEYGHSSPTIKEPFKCPKVPTNFILQVKHIAKKYNVSEDMVAQHGTKKKKYTYTLPR